MDSRHASAGARGPEPVEFGAFYLGSDRAAQAENFFGPADFARAAESIGFDSVWGGDHIVQHYDALVTLGAFAGATTSIAIGTAVVVLPMRPAAVVAKGVLSAALAAGERRTILGAGAGGDVRIDFEAVGADLSTRGPYTDEALEVIRLLWSGENVSFSGRWNNFTDLRVSPLPTRSPEIFIGGRGDVALRRAVRFGDGFLPYLMDPIQARSRYDTIVELSRGVRPLERFTFGITTFLVPASSSDEAVRLTQSHQAFDGLDDARLRRFYLLGSVEECLIQLRPYVESGANHVVIGCSPGNERQLDAYMETMSEVLPRIRAEVAAGLGQEARRQLQGV